jgi:hypothetical protein
MCDNTDLLRYFCIDTITCRESFATYLLPPHCVNLFVKLISVKFMIVITDHFPARLIDGFHAQNGKDV